MSDVSSVEEVARELDSLIQLLEAHPDADVQRLALRLLDRVDALHRAGLTALILALRDGNAAGPMQRALDELPVRILLQIYDLLPGDDPAPIEIALDQVRPMLTANGGQISLVGVQDGVPRLRVEATNGEAVTLLRELVTAVLREHFPALQTIRFEEAPRAQADELLPIFLVDRAPAQAWGWYPLRRLHEVPEDSIVAESVQGRRVAIWRVGADVVVVRDICPGSGLPIAAAALEDDEVKCPWHGCRFDARTGRRLQGPGESLDICTTAVRDGVVEVELPAEAAPARRAG